MLLTISSLFLVPLWSSSGSRREGGGGEEGEEEELLTKFSKMSLSNKSKSSSSTSSSSSSIVGEVKDYAYHVILFFILELHYTSWKRAQDITSSSSSSSSMLTISKLLLMSWIMSFVYYVLKDKPRKEIASYSLLTLLVAIVGGCSLIHPLTHSPTRSLTRSLINERNVCGI